MAQISNDDISDASLGGIVTRFVGELAEHANRRDAALAAANERCEALEAALGAERAARRAADEQAAAALASLSSLRTLAAALVFDIDAAIQGLPAAAASGASSKPAPSQERGRNGARRTPEARLQSPDGTPEPAHATHTAQRPGESSRQGEDQVSGVGCVTADAEDGRVAAGDRIAAAGVPGDHGDALVPVTLAVPAVLLQRAERTARSSGVALSEVLLGWLVSGSVASEAPHAARLSFGANSVGSRAANGRSEPVSPP